MIRVLCGVHACERRLAHSFFCFIFVSLSFIAHVPHTFIVISLRIPQPFLNHASLQPQHSDVSTNPPQVILAFARPIWPEGFFDVVCLDCFVPEFWVTTYQPTTPNGAALHGITGFLAGAAAEVASALSPEEILQRTLTQLDSMFGA